MRIAVGQFMEESNTFVRQRADLEHFRNNQLLSGDETATKLRGTRVEVGGFLDTLEPAGVEVVPTVAANCVSSGPVPRATFEALAGELVRRLAATGPVDGVLLALHGSMVLDDHPDAEGELLAAVRKQVGPTVPMVATLDLHAHVTPRMVEEADALVGYDTYPHVDPYETGGKAARLILRVIRGAVRPVTLLAKSPMIVPAEGMGTGDQPMAGLMAEAKRLDAVFTARPDGVVIQPSPTADGMRTRIAELALRHRVPTAASFREYADTGVLVTYAPDMLAVHRRAAVYVDKLPKGARAADLPVEQPTKFELVVNLRTARALGITIPQAILLRADEILQ